MKKKEPKELHQAKWSMVRTFIGCSIVTALLVVWYLIVRGTRSEVKCSFFKDGCLATSLTANIKIDFLEVLMYISLGIMVISLVLFTILNRKSIANLFTRLLSITDTTIESEVITKTNDK